MRRRIHHIATITTITTLSIATAGTAQQSTEEAPLALEYKLKEGDQLGRRTKIGMQASGEGMPRETNLNAEDFLADLVGEPAPSFALHDLDGNKVMRSDFEGEVLILNFWATWCPSCTAEIPHFIELYDRYKDQGFAVVGITVWSDIEEVKSLVQQRQVNYPILMADGEVEVAYGGIGAVPTTFVIDKEGIIQRHYVGYEDKAVFEADIQALSAQLEDTSPPAVTGQFPPPEEQNVPVSPNIVLRVQDSGDGVDISSIEMQINSLPVIPQITGTPSDYTVTYVPSSPFAYDSIVNVTVNAQDLHSPPNVMNEITYSFRTQPEGIISEEWGDGIGSDHAATVEDTYIRNEVNHAADPTHLNTYTWPEKSIANAILMKFDLRAIPRNATVTTAKLYLYMFEASNDPTYNISIHKIVNVDPVISAATGYTYDGTNPWTPYEGLYGNVPLGQSDIASAEDRTAVDATAGYKKWMIIRMVSEWVANPAANYGFMLNSDPNAAANAYRYFRPSEYTDAAQRPRLVISYTPSMDTDGDGVGDNADPDDDNDGYTDVDELTENQSDPLDANSLPPDSDNDKLSDLNDPDDDNDGMPDTWEDQYEGLDSTVNDADQDKDEDGQSNYVEYVAGTDPTSSDSRFCVLHVTPDPEDTAILRVSWETAPGTSYNILWAGSMEGPWHEIGQLEPGDIVINGDIRTWTDKGTDPAMEGRKPGDCPARFYKLAAYR